MPWNAASSSPTRVRPRRTVLALLTWACSSCFSWGGMASSEGSRFFGPTIALASPSPGGAVPADRPSVVFRLVMPAEPRDATPADSIDARSFRLWVDGGERTSAFRVELDEARGMIAESSATTPTSLSPDRAHAVSARICSWRGVCATTHAVVLVLPPATLPAPATSRGDTSTARGNADALAPAAPRPHSLLGLLLLGLQRILWPPF